LLPHAGVRVEGVGELLAAFVGDFIGPCGGAEEGDAEGVACCVVAVLGVVEDGKALLGVAQVGPAHGGDFELGFLPGVVAGGGALDGAVGDLVGGFGASGGEKRLRRTWVSCQSISFVTEVGSVEERSVNNF
jgi:hypothetical protein